MARRKSPRGKPASTGYRAAKRRSAKLQKKVARRRQDEARKWAKAVVQDFDRIAVEDFHPRFLASSTMARKAADAAIGMVKMELLNMARKHGRELRLIDPAYTTMDCGVCGARAKRRLPLSERVYNCTTCGFESNRDENAALVVLNRAGFNPAGVENIRPGRSLSVQAV
ncbi:RNA-guided endonuclease InsQ/TnpB family protein [Nocardia sp. NPDC020380]|uniref:RNA-guided endonuclease InsQ/TnpB family protein n=1 Tax=Nocardia sp. NPDC020380 TaxID=3364309 RepID=UPI0037ABACCE